MISSNALQERVKGEIVDKKGEKQKGRVLSRKRRKPGKWTVQPHKAGAGKNFPSKKEESYCRRRGKAGRARARSRANGRARPGHILHFTWGGGP